MLAAIERDGKFFFYFGNKAGEYRRGLQHQSGGPFSDLVMVRSRMARRGVSSQEYGCSIRACLLMTTGRRAFTGGNGDQNVRCAKLNRDTIQPLEYKDYRRDKFLRRYVFKRQGVTSITRRGRTCALTMTSDNPTNGFIYRGIGRGSPPINDNNNHAAQFEFKGRWYHAVVIIVVAKQAGIPTAFRRNPVIEEFQFRRRWLD